MTRHRNIPATLAALAALTVAACAQSPAGVDPGGLSAADAAALAPEYDQLGDVMFDGFGAPSYSAGADGAAPSFAAQTVTTTFTRTRTCPGGGDVTVAGTIVNTWDREARTASHDYSAIRTENDCVLPARRGEGTITIDGNPNTAITSHWSIANGVPGVRTRTAKGSFTWTRSTGQSGTCTVDLTATWNPATHTYTLQGTFCNRTIDVTRVRS